ncbi:MAG: hypothetical protein K2M34_03470 [Alphaproteobacteria bacterium]|nr:hypothetical protein [Alphaproteobacteria bacterium]
MGQLVSDVSEVLDYKDAKKQASTTRKQILAQMAEDEKTKTNLVKKALAAQRAKYGASGMTNKGMTEDAVLKRLQGEAAAPYEEKRKTNLEKLRSTRAKKPNLLKSVLSRFDNIVG